jgi:hypothetical protein
MCGIGRVWRSAQGRARECSRLPPGARRRSWSLGCGSYPRRAPASGISNGDAKLRRCGFSMPRAIDVRAPNTHRDCSARPSHAQRGRDLPGYAWSVRDNYALTPAGVSARDRKTFAPRRATGRQVDAHQLCDAFDGETPANPRHAPKPLRGQGSKARTPPRSLGGVHREPWGRVRLQPARQ